MQPAMQAALIAAAVAIVGWYATYAYAKRKEDRARRIEIHVKYRQRQIEELYGPLSSLVQQLLNIWQIRDNILNRPGKGYSDDEIAAIREFIWKNYFHPVHGEIAALMRTKLYLLEGGQIPSSFADYLQHATQEECQHRLRDDLNLDTSNARFKTFPSTFPGEVQETLQRLMRDHQSGVETLQR